MKDSDYQIFMEVKLSDARKDLLRQAILICPNIPVTYSVNVGHIWVTGL